MCNWKKCVFCHCFLWYSVYVTLVHLVSCYVEIFIFTEFLSACLISIWEQHVNTSFFLLSHVVVSYWTTAPSLSSFPMKRTLSYITSKAVKIRKLISMCYRHYSSFSNCPSKIFYNKKEQLKITCCFSCHDSLISFNLEQFFSLSFTFITLTLF